MTLSEELSWRGFVNQTTFGDLKALDKKKWVFYHGFDASADSQTVGNLAAMMLDKLFLRHGHHGIILAGGATSLVGDPGGKDTERPLQDEKTIAANVARAEAQLKKILSGQEFKLVNNLAWTKSMTVIEFLRDVGKHFSMTPLVQRDYIAKRLGEGGAGISYAEFSYTILQGYDYLHLYDKYNVTLQLGGSDQWGNCLSGVELVRKARGQEVHVITLPLIINKATGKKFGKTEEGAIWLDPAKTSVFKFYQFWLNSDDDSVSDYLKIFTELDKDEIAGLMKGFEKNRSERSAQKKLAYEVTKTVHGQTKAESVRRITSVLFSDAPISDIKREDVNQLKNELPHIQFKAGATIAEAVVKTGLASSLSEARRLIDQGGIHLNSLRVDSGQTLKQDDRQAGGAVLLKRGKNLFALID
ncbi:MAG TPA: tyrosine--tRNA ligase [Patescibacteria group bacterium]|nr:tyrosine--tRNA ligase [Patescibacteria group bacterium]